MAVASLGPYGGVQNMMLMRNDNNADSLVAMLASCSPHLSLQQVSRSMGGLEDVNCGGRLGGQQKRPYYAPYVNGPASVEEPSEDGDEGADEFSQHVEKKRRLSFDQVRSLERNFEVENKLEPERKMQLAKELGLQPRQVAVWFQNRRARWKIKQLERDYEALTQDYNRLQADLEAVTRDKNLLKAEMNRLKGITSTEDDAKPVESEQCRSDHPGSPVPSEQSDIDHPSSRASPAIDDVNAAMAAAKEMVAAGVKRTSSSNSINSSHVVDADSPCTSDSCRSSAPSNRTSPQQHSGMVQAQQHPVPGDSVAWTQYAQFPPESFVGPHLMPDLCSADDQAELSSQVVVQAHRGAGVKIEDMDQSFLLSRLEEQPVLPSWWDWA